jgi:hypothetical protein
MAIGSLIASTFARSSHALPAAAASAISQVPPPPSPLPLFRVVGCSCVDVDLSNLYVPPCGLIRLPDPSTPHLLYSPALEQRLVLSGKYITTRIQLLGVQA